MAQDAWKPIELESNSTLLARIGPLRLYIHHHRDEVHIATDYPPGELGPAEIGPIEGAPSDLEWTRWVAGRDFEQIQLRPTTPDRSCVVRPELPVKIPTDREAYFYVRVPLWICVTIPGQPELTLSEVPSIVLSNTWFGDPQGGELCYSMRTTARREAEEETVRSNRVVVPVRVRNEADEALEVQRICLAVKHLNIYRGQRCLWANRVKATFRGEQETSRIEFDDQPPDQAGQAELLAAHREPVHEGFFRRTFVSSIMNLKIL
ncbi:MAG: DUF432 domain-containing protein [Phycisphaerae bacterium]